VERVGTSDYSRYKVNSYTVTFDTNGGSRIPAITVNEGNTISMPIAPTKAGYTFEGWYKNSECTISWNFANAKITGNITLYSKWILNIYNVTFETDGGTSIGGISVNYDSTISSPNTPQKSNYTFGGWYKDSGYTAPWNFKTDKITENTTLYAKWIINMYTVSYYGNGNKSGSVPIDNKKYKLDGNVTVMGNVGNLAKYGYVFAGWNTKADGTGVNYAGGNESFKIKGNTVLYVNWIVKNTANIMGTVVDGNRPVNNATVTLKGRGKTFVTRTDANGTYVIKNIPAGNGFIFTVAKAGYKEGKITGIKLISNKVTSGINVVLKKLSSAKDITGFTVKNQVGKSVINVKNHTVTFHVKYGTDVKRFAPSITVSRGAIITPGSRVKQNFKKTISYTVKAEDGTKQIWIVKCVIDPKEK